MLLLLTNRFITIIGRVSSISVLLMALITTVIVTLRYVFQWNSVALQESVGYLHALLLLTAIPWALQQDQHVRVDIFYRKLSSIQKAWVNIIGLVFFLIPFALFSFNASSGMMLRSWAILEGSPQAGGLPFYFILKSLIPISFTLIILQGIAMLTQQIKQIMASYEEV